MKKQLLASVSLVLFLCLSSSFTQKNKVTVIEIENRVFELINKQRISSGKAELVMNEVIRSEARRHSQDMASGDTAVGHEGFIERNCRIGLKIKHSKMAENVAYNYIGAAVSVDQWLKSVYQRKNILGDYRRTGIGVAKRGCDYYFTEIFID